MKVVDKTASRVSVTIGTETFSLPLAINGRDARRSIYEAPYGTGVLQFFQIHAAHLPLGKHFHRLKDEVFTIVEGGGSVIMSEVDGQGRPIDSNGVVLEEANAVIKRQQLVSGDVVTVNRFTAHTFYLTPGSEMVCLSSLPFDQNDMPSTPWLVQEEVPAV